MTIVPLLEDADLTSPTAIPATAEFNDGAMPTSGTGSLQERVDRLRVHALDGSHQLLVWVRWKARLVFVEGNAAGGATLDEYSTKDGDRAGEQQKFGGPDDPEVDLVLEAEEVRRASRECESTPKDPNYRQCPLECERVVRGRRRHLGPLITHARKGTSRKVSCHRAGLRRSVRMCPPFLLRIGRAEFGRRGKESPERIISFTLRVTTHSRTSGLPSLTEHLGEASDRRIEGAFVEPVKLVFPPTRPRHREESFLGTLWRGEGTHHQAGFVALPPDQDVAVGDVFEYGSLDSKSRTDREIDLRPGFGNPAFSGQSLSKPLGVSKIEAASPVAARAGAKNHRTKRGFPG